MDGNELIHRYISIYIEENIKNAAGTACGRQSANAAEQNRNSGVKE